MKNQFGNKNLPCSVKKTDANCSLHVVSGLYHPSVIRNTAHVDFKGKIFADVRFVKVSKKPDLVNTYQQSTTSTKLFLNV